MLARHAFFLAVVVRENKPTPGPETNVTWLLATVSTQSVAVLRASLVDPFDKPATIVLFGALVLFSDRLHALPVDHYPHLLSLLHLPEPETATLTPPAWISMGAVGITTPFAGATLLLAGDHSPLVSEMAPFLRGFTLFFWAAGTWWIPLLLLLGAWRHLWRRHALSYDPQYWAMVFPLGMYAAATWQLAAALPMAPLAALARATLPVALLAWSATALGMVHTWWRWSRDA